MYKKSMIFEIFGAYVSEVLIFLHEIFLGSKILFSSCDKHQKFDYRYSSYPGNEAQSSDFGRFLTILDIFELFVLAQAFSLRHNFFYEKLV